MRFKSSNEDGLSVIELAVGIVIFLGVSVTAASVVINTSNSVANSTEIAYLNNELNLASQLIVKEINDSTKIVDSSSTSITLSNENGGTTVIAADPSKSCSVTINKYAADANVLVDSLEVMNKLDSCDIFSASDSTVSILLTSSLNENDTFKIQAEAVSGYYTESVDSGAFTPAALLSAPTALTVVEPIGRNTVPLTWEPVTEALSYVVQTSTDGVSWKLFDKYIINGNTTVNGLRPATPYYFRVAAKNADGIGSYSETVQATTLDGTLSEEPTNIQTVKTPTTISISWDYPADDGGYSVYSYNYRYSSDQTNWIEGTAVVNEATIINLKKNTDYYIQVAAVNIKGVGSYGNAAIYPTKTDSTAPSAPLNVTLDALASGSTVSANWSLPEDNGGITDLTYTAQYSSDGILWSTGMTVSEMNAQVTGVPKNSLVYVRVKANNIMGSSEWVQNSIQTPATVPNAPTGLTTSVLTAKTMTIDWTPPTSNNDTGGLPITGYRIERDTNSSFTSPVTLNNTGQTSLDITGLTRATPYYFRIYTINTMGVSAGYASAMFETLTTVPDAPTLNAGSVTYESATISWTPGADNGGAAVTGFNIYNDGVKINTTPVAPDITTYTATGLTELTTYNFTVTAVNSRGESPQQASPVTLTTYPKPPTAPSNLVASNVTQTSFDMTWDASTGVLDGYRIYKNDVLVNTTLNTSWNFTGLSAGTSYTIKIEAYNIGGVTSASLTTVTKLGAPVDLTATEVTTSGMRLTWNAPDSTGATKFIIKMDGQPLAEVPSTQLYYDVTSQPANSRHTFTVRAANNVTDSADAKLIWSTKPVKPSGVSLVSKTSTTVTVKWNEDLTSSAAFSKFYIYANGVLMGSQNGTRIAGDTTPISSQFTINNLVEISAYEITVVEANDHATSAPSTPLTVVTDFEPLTMNIDYAAETAIKISWSGSPLSNIEYSVYLNGALTGTVPAGMTKTYRFAGLEPDTAYTVDVIGSVSVLGVKYTSNSNLKNTRTLAQPALPAGTVAMSGLTTAPAGWLVAQGSSLADYPELAAATGKTTAPDFRGRTAVGLDQEGTIDAEFDTLGETGGVKAVALSVNEIPAHTHTQYAHTHTMPDHNHTQYSHNAGRPNHGHGSNSSFTVSSGWGGGASGIPGGNSWWGCCGNAHWNLTYGATGSANGSGDQWSDYATASVYDRAAGEVVNQNSGSSAAHTNLMPYSVINFIVKTTNGTSGNYVQRPGTIIMSLSTTAPAGYKLADGSTYSTAAYPELAYALGQQQLTTGTLPNLDNGQVVVGLKSTDADFATIGKTGGAKTEVIDISEMPRHTHIQNAHNHAGIAHTMTSPSHGHGDNGHGHGYNQYFTVGGIGGGGSSGIPNGSSWWGCCGSAHWYTPNYDGGDSNNAATATNAASTTPSLNASSNTVSQSTGGGAAHTNIQPYMVVKYYIKY